MGWMELRGQQSVADVDPAVILRHLDAVDRATARHMMHIHNIPPGRERDDLEHSVSLINLRLRDLRKRVSP